MTHLKQEPRTVVARLRTLALMAAAAALLAGCETTGSGPAPEAAKPPDPPMTHSRAASECWMKTEKGSAGVDIDKRADIVNKCIDEKMKTATSGTAEPAPAAPAPDAKKKKPAVAAAADKKQPASPAAGEPDKKPADAADKKP